jgi:hypothetical protein
MLAHLVSVVVSVAPSAFACPGRAEATALAQPAGDTCADQKIGADTDPAASARRVELVGAEACAWTTGAMARRVLEEGSPWTFVGKVEPTANALPSKVAAPYTIGPGGEVHVIANAVLEKLQASGLLGERLEFVGRLLEVDDTTYFVATEVSANRS